VELLSYKIVRHFNEINTNFDAVGLVDRVLGQKYSSTSVKW